MRVLSRKGLVPAFVLLLAILFANGLISFVNTRALTDYQQQVVHSYAVLSDINGVLNAATDAETGQRGYLLTDRPAYLAPYRVAARRLPARLDDLQQLTRDNPTQQTAVLQLRQLIRGKLRTIRQTITLQRTGRRAAALSIVRTNQGKRIMSEIRKVVRGMQHEETRLLQSRTATAQRHGAIATGTIAVATLVNLALVVFLFLLVRAAIREREQVSQERTESLTREQAARRQAEMEQRRVMTLAAERAAMLSQIAEGIVVADRGGAISYINSAGQEILGVSDLGTPVSRYGEVFHTFRLDGTPYPSEELPLARAVLQAEKVVDAPIVIHRPDGRRAIVEASATPFFADDGEQLGAVVTFRDVTTQRDLERQKDEFLSTVAHDLKTPLTTMKGMAQILQRRAGRAGGIEPARLIDGLERIDRTSSRMASLIDDLLDLTRIDMGHLLDMNRRPTDLVALAKQLVAGQQDTSQKHQVTLSTDLPELVGRWDTNRLYRVLSNLLSNSIKYSPDGGDVTVSVSHAGAGEDSWAVVAVQDHGMGIAAADLAQIFDRFQRGRNVPDSIPGTGIGLAGAKQIVEQHGGTIEVESRIGAGSTFILRLPLNVETGDDRNDGTDAESEQQR